LGAADDLLAACKEVSAWAANPFAYDADQRPMWDRLEAAIAKAEGGAQ
jgi:hypothetical protein